MKKLIFIMLCLILAVPAVNAKYYYQFKPTNGPYGGWIWKFSYDQNNDESFANLGRIYKLNKSTDEWERKFAELDTLEYYRTLQFFCDSIYFVPYVRGRSDQVWEGGLFRSSDKGSTWVDLQKENYSFNSIIFVNHKYFLGSSENLYKSTDYGITWFPNDIKIDSGGTVAKIYQMEKLNISDNDIVLARSYNDGIFLSTDSGENWINISKNIPGTSFVRFTSMCTTTKNEILVACTSGIYISNDLGNTWTKTIKGLDSFYEMRFIKCDNKYNFFTGGYRRGFYRLQDNDTIWRIYDKSLLPFVTMDLLVNKTKNELLLATDGGIYKSTNNGDSWFDYNKGIIFSVTANTIAINSNGAILCGSDENGIYSTIDKGNNWNTTNAGIKIPQINKIRIDSKGVFYALDDGTNIYKSNDNGLNWETIISSPDSRNLYYNDFAINSNNEILFSLTKREKVDSNDYRYFYFLLTTKDEGKTYDTIFNKYVTSFVYDRLNNIYINSNSSIYLSKNNGKSWEKVYKLDSTDRVTCFWATKTNLILAGTFDGYLLRSTDNGLNWNKINPILNKSLSITNIISRDSDNLIICGTDFNGFLISLDDGLSWEIYNYSPYYGQIAIKQLKDFAVDADGTIYVAAYDGVSRLEEILSVATSGKTNDNFYLSPIPATDYISINTSEINSRVNPTVEKVEIYSIEGMLMQSTSPQPSPFLDRAIQVDVSGFVPGVYFVKIGGRVQRFVKI